MRDFHDAKKLFKRLDEIVSNRRKRHFEENPYLASMPKEMQHVPGCINWVEAQIYVVDFFLWYMGKCGYTLQKTRQKGKYADVEYDLEQFQKRYDEARWAAIKESDHGTT
jgi:hypothetical protein